MRVVKNVHMDRLFVNNIEDKEVMFDSARDVEGVRGVPPKNTQNSTSANLTVDKQPS